MRKILTSKQMHEVDAYTIKSEPVSSLDLMERASTKVADVVMRLFGTDRRMFVFAGPGCNGGDALAVARMLARHDYEVHVFLFNPKGRLAGDCRANKERLLLTDKADFHEVISEFNPPDLSAADVVVDGLFGTGLSSPLSGLFADVVDIVNSSPSTVVSIDVPSGLMTEDNSSNDLSHAVRADITLTFQLEKLSYLFAEHERLVGELRVLDIGLIDPDDSVTSTPYYIYEKRDAEAALKPRSKFAHKGTFGHACLIAGKQGMAGAAVMAAKACMRSGVGKLTVHTAACNLLPLQCVVPEAIIDAKDTECFSSPFVSSQYDALAIGPGLGTAAVTAKSMVRQMEDFGAPVVLDADALNILSSDKRLLRSVPQGSVLTPHKKELRGLIGETRDSFEELQRTREFAGAYGLYVVMKGAYTATVTPEGKVFFNTTGNPGMATAGSGDVLTGVILALLAQGYPSLQAATLGVFLHGLAGDLAADALSEAGMTATDIISYLPHAFKALEKPKHWFDKSVQDLCSHD